MHGARMHSEHADQRKGVSWRYASATDLFQFYGEHRPETMRAIVVLKNDEPLIVMGLIYRRDSALLFSDYKPEAWEFRHSMAVLRAIKKVMALVIQSQRPVYSVRQEGSDLLDRLGFTPVSEDVYRWHS